MRRDGAAGSHSNIRLHDAVRWEVGLVAARLKERYGRPSFAIALEPGEFRWQRPFSATRAMEARIAPSRSCKRSPAAASGGRPSSVSALRTARQ